MRKFIFSLVILTMCSAAAFSQVKVSNGFGQTLKVTINEQTATIPNNGVQAFSATGSAVLIKCETADGTIKFSVAKAVPASNLIIISPADGQTSQTLRNPSGQIKLIYKGSISFKIFSVLGRGLEFSASDSVNYINDPKGELVLGIGIKEGNGEDQSIWPYAEIRKRFSAHETVCRISDADIKRLSNKPLKGKNALKIMLTAQEYKIYVSSQPESISLSCPKGSRGGISKGKIETPIGQFYLKASYTDPKGMFHQTVFIPKHVTSSDSHLDISEQDLKNAVQLDW